MRGLLLCVALGIFFVVPSAPAAAPAIAKQHATQTRAQQRAQTAKVKAEIRKRGAGKKSRVKVTLNNKTQIKGSITKIGEDSFALTDWKTRQVRIVSYDEVGRIQSAHW